MSPDPYRERLRLLSQVLAEEQKVTGIKLPLLSKLAVSEILASHLDNGLSATC